MEKLLAYVNALDREARKDFFRRCGTSEGYIRKACSANQLLRPKLCVRIEECTKKKVTRKVLRPDDWSAIWPELRSRRAVVQAS